MRLLSELDRARVAAVRGVLSDIDDTITTDGRLTGEAYSAMERLHEAGYLVIPVTGRPAGWCDHIARMWPVDAVVGENGAFYMRYDQERRKLTTRHVGNIVASADVDNHRPSPAANQRQRLHAIGERILREVPGSAWASDQAFRFADIAIDFCEDVPRLADSGIDRIVALMREEGLTAKVSSIHVNGWFGAYDKLGMTRTLLAEAFSIDIDSESDRASFIFVGDSPNDAPMFQFFPLSVGVQNVTDFVLPPDQQPKFVTSGRSGSGFAEVVRHLIGRSDIRRFMPTT